MNAVTSLAGQLQLVGAVLVVLGLAHLALPQVLAWPAELAQLTPLTRQIMNLHTLFIGLVCVLAGLLPLVFTADLLTGGRLGTALLAGQCLFWGMRWCAQFVAFKPELWRGSRLYTAGFVGFAVLWTWVVAVFGAALAYAW